MKIAGGADMLLKIDQRTGPYARVQVDVDCSTELPEKILVQGTRAGFDFSLTSFMNLCLSSVMVVGLWGIKWRHVGL